VDARGFYHHFAFYRAGFARHKPQSRDKLGGVARLHLHFAAQAERAGDPAERDERVVGGHDLIEDLDVDLLAGADRGCLDDRPDRVHDAALPADDLSAILFGDAQQ
jgi:hypothetical protein